MTAETERALDLWAPRRQMTLAQARARSNVVKKLRLGLVIMAMITFGVFIGFTGGNMLESLLSGRNEARSTEMVTMINPRFRGRDSTGNPYIIVADSAQRRRANNDLVDLQNPKLTDAFGSEVIAPIGLWNRELEVLELFENVVLSDAAGYVFYTTHARIYTDDGRVEGVEPLQGTGPLGDVRSDTYELLENGDHVRLTGRVRVDLYEEEATETE